MKDVEQNVRKIKKAAKKPVAVGFGISTSKQVSEVSGFADGVIIGSALVRYVEGYRDGQESLKNIHQFITELKNGIR